MYPNINRPWVEAYLRAALEVDGQKMPQRIVAAREAVAGRFKDLEGNSDHHAERDEMQSALAALTSLQDETRIWPTAAITHSSDVLLSNRGQFLFDPSTKLSGGEANVFILEGRPFARGSRGY